MAEPKTVRGKKRALRAGELPIPDIKELGSLSPSQYRKRIRRLTGLVVPKKGGEVDDAVKLRTIGFLIQSGSAEPERALKDMEFLGKLGVTFEPIHTVSGPKTANQAMEVWGVSLDRVSKCLSDPGTRKDWGAQKVNVGGHVAWRIPAKTVNRVNVELKTAVSLGELYGLLRNRKVNMAYTRLKRLFEKPSEMREIGRELMAAKGKENLLVNTLYGSWKNYTDVTSAAGVVRFLLAEKKLDTGLSSKEVGERLGVTHVSRLLHRGELPGTLVTGMVPGEARVRLTEEELADALKARRPEERALIKELKAIKPPEGLRKVIVEYPGGFDRVERGSIAGIIRKHRGPGNVPEGERTRLAKFGVRFREQTDEEARRGLIIRELTNRYGSTEGISRNVSKFGLAKLGLEIERKGKSWTIRPIEER